MVEVKQAAELAKKALSEATETLILKEQKLAKELKTGRALREANTKLQEQKKEAKLKLKEIQSWIKEINPNYNPFNPWSTYNNNCGSCALAVHNRLKGYKDIVAGRINIAPQDTDMEELTGLKCKYMKPADIEKILVSRGPGSELIVGVNRSEGPGHWFNVFYDGDKIYTVDGQSGRVMDWPHDYKKVTAWCALI